MTATTAMITPAILCGGSARGFGRPPGGPCPSSSSQLLGAMSTFQATVRRVADPAHVRGADRDHPASECRFIVAEQLREIGVDGRHHAGARAAAIRRRRRGRGGAGRAAQPRARRARPGRRPRHRRRGRLRGLPPGGARGRSARHDHDAGRRARPARPRATATSSRARPARARRALRGRALRREARRRDGRALHRGGLPVEQRQLPVPRRRDAGGARALRARDAGRGARRPWTTRCATSTSCASMRRPSPKAPEDLHRLRGAWSSTAAAGVLPVSFAWSDVGAWDAVWELARQDELGNAVRGRVELVDTRNSLVHSDGMLTARGRARGRRRGRHPGRRAGHQAAQRRRR